jgi:hypothetical protein
MYQTGTSAPKNPLHCGTITADEIRKMDRAAAREERIASGISPTSGCGAHGGNQRTLNRRDRREAKRQARNWQND